jgi:hypothetical protein
MPSLFLRPTTRAAREREESSRARELAATWLTAPEVTRRNTRGHFIKPLKERIVREVGYELSPEGASQRPW